MRIFALGLLAALAGGWAWGQAPVERVGGRIDLPSSKQIVGLVPGVMGKVGSLPVSMAASPDGRWVVTVNAGYGSALSHYEQSLAVVDTRTGAVREFPDARTLLEAKQTLFSGLAFSADGRHVYASAASISDPEGTRPGDTGSGIAVYSFVDGVIAPERVMKIAPQPLAAGRVTKEMGGKDGTLGQPYVAAIARVPGGKERLLVADQLSDAVLLMDAASGAVEKVFDVSENVAVPSTYPVSVAVSADGRRGFVALWNASEVVELDLASGQGRKIALLKPEEATAPGSHPTAVALSPDGKTLYVALGNRDAVAAVDVGGEELKVKGYFDVRLPGQSYFGAEPEALAVNGDGSRVYCADMGADAVAVLDPGKMTKGAVKRGMVEPVAYVPTEWLPMGVAWAGGKVYIASGKGTGTGPNNFAQESTAETATMPRFKRSFSYIPTLLHGSVAVVSEASIGADGKAMTAAVLEDNRMRAGAERIAWAPGVLAEARAAAAARAKAAGAVHTTGTAVRIGEPNANPDYAPGQGPIRHVIYIIKENRTYDQIFGDLTKDAKAVGNGDASLAMYGEDITPNQHALALQFGVMDNFYDSAEVSGDGHVWSNTAIGTDALERTWQINYRGREHTYDYEGVVAEGLPLAQNIPDVVEPASGYIWGNVVRHGLSVYHFGEYISSTFCTDKGETQRQDDPTLGPMGEGKVCSRSSVKPGETMPVVWGGGVNRFQWAIPLIASNTATKPELVGHFAPEAPDFNLRIPDQIRAEVFLRHLAVWEKDRAEGQDTMPAMIQLRLPNDHTAGTVPGGPTPKASVADNDLAIGRVVEAISHSAYWADTAFFIVEDDAQNGADHVDAHRSTALVVSRFSPRGKDGAAFVDSRFYSTVSMIRTMETVLGLPPMNNNDALSSMMGSLFGGAGDQPAFTADRRNQANGLIYTANTKRAVGARASSRMDFSHADRANARVLNVILWEDAMGPQAPVPSMLTEKRKLKKDDDDD